MRYRLRVILAERSLNRVQLSLRTGLSRPTIDRVFYSKSGIKMETLEIIAKDLNCKVKDLLDE
ncbi:MAG: helix-turn-helix domain-containing protein [Ignavibacteriales bacterium]